MANIDALITKDDIHQMNKWLHNDGGSTAKLSTLEMVDYHNRIREHHATMDGVEFPEIINRDDYYG